MFAAQDGNRQRPPRLLDVLPPDFVLGTSQGRREIRESAKNGKRELRMVRKVNVERAQAEERMRVPPLAVINWGR